MPRALSVLIALALATSAAAEEKVLYHGTLSDAGAPANGVYDLQFVIAGGANNPLARFGPLVMEDVAVSNGAFTVSLPLQGLNIETGTVEIGVRDGSSNAGFELLPDKQPFTTDAVAGCTASWDVVGNAGTVAGNFLGTTDAGPLEFRVNNQRILRFDGNNTLGGYKDNTVTAGIVAATVFGGYFFTSPGVPNRALANGVTLSGGWGNTAGAAASALQTVSGGSDNLASGNASVVGGGQQHTAGGAHSTVSGGLHNTASTVRSTVGGGQDNNASGDASTIGGGQLNAASGLYSTVAGGVAHTATGPRSTIGGGSGNIADQESSTVAGGYQNKARGFDSAIGGGELNEINGLGGAIPGGVNNFATAYSFAAGRRGKAVNQGSFLWSDSTDADFSTSGDNQFVARAAGGVGFNSTVIDPIDDFVIGPRTGGNLDTGLSLKSASGKRMYFVQTDLGTSAISAFSNLKFFASSFGFNVDPVAGRYLNTDANGAHLTTGGTWTNGSSRAFKEGFKALDPAAVLQKVLGLDITRWSYRGSVEGTHIGPTAEDFYAAFETGADAEHIATVDADGVALAAIQGLHAQTEQELKRLHDENRALRDSVEQLQQQLAVQQSTQAELMALVMERLNTKPGSTADIIAGAPAQERP